MGTKAPALTKTGMFSSVTGTVSVWPPSWRVPVHQLNQVAFRGSGTVRAVAPFSMTGATRKASPQRKVSRQSSISGRSSRYISGRMSGRPAVAFSNMRV